MVLLPVRGHTPTVIICKTKQLISWESVQDMLQDLHGKFLPKKNIDMPLSQLSSKSSRVSHRLCAFASLCFMEYSDQTRAESMNSASRGWRYRYKLGISCSFSWDMPAWKWVTITRNHQWPPWSMSEKNWPITSVCFEPPQDSLGDEDVAYLTTSRDRQLL